MKKILLVADQPGWIFDRHCHEIQKRLSNEFEIAIAYHRQNIPELSKQYDVVYVMDPMPMAYPPPEKTIMGLRCEFLFREHPNGAQGLYSEGFPGRCVSMQDKCSILHMVNQFQMDTFKDIVTDRPLLLVPHGVDETIFDKNKHGRIDNSTLRVSVSGRGSQNKGFGYVNEACQKLGINIMAAQYGRNKLTKEQMPDFYKGVDIHVCMSKDEGLNNPMLEAGAMGIPVISTRSGAAEQIIQNDVNGLLIDRTVDDLVQALTKLKDNHDILISMGNNMYNEIMTNWTWKVKIDGFRKMFNLYFGDIEK